MSVIGARLSNATIANQRLCSGFPDFQYFSAFMQERDLRIAYVRDPPGPAIPAYDRARPQSLKPRCEIRDSLTNVRRWAVRRCSVGEYLDRSRFRQTFRV